MDVKIYTTPTCMFCHQAKDFFNENNIKYEELDVTKNEQARNELISKGYRGVPVIVIDGEEILGFDQQRVSELLNI